MSFTELSEQEIIRRNSLNELAKLVAANRSFTFSL